MADTARHRNSTLDSVVIFEPSSIFLLGVRFFSGAGQFVFQFHLSFDQALINAFQLCTDRNYHNVLEEF